MPYSPNIAAAIIKPKRNNRKETPILKEGVAKAEIAVNPITMTIIGLTTPADTAASPITNPPTIPMVWPIGEGNRSPASCNNSIVSTIRKASTTGGKGTASRVAAIDNAISVGNRPGCTEIKEIYNAGRSIAKKNGDIT